MCAAAIIPREPLVPYKIVEHCRLDSQTGCPHVVAAEDGQRFESHELNHDADGANQSEFRRTLKAGAPKRGLQSAIRRSSVHEIFSSR
jgi:hypothetical protein